MVWDGVSTLQVYEDYFIWEATKFDADNELTLLTDFTELIGFAPSHYTMAVARTVGVTNAIDMRLQARHSDDTGATYNFITVTDSRGMAYIKSSSANYGATSKTAEEALTHLRIFVVTVGLGNTLTVKVIGRR